MNSSVTGCLTYHCIPKLANLPGLTLTDHTIFCLLIHYLYKTAWPYTHWPYKILPTYSLVVLYFPSVLHFQWNRWCVICHVCNNDRWDCNSLCGINVRNHAYRRIQLYLPRCGTLHGNFIRSWTSWNPNVLCSLWLLELGNFQKFSLQWPMFKWWILFPN